MSATRYSPWPEAGRWSAASERPLHSRLIRHPPPLRTLAAAAWIYLVARILYVPAYASGVFLVRSLIWTVGFVATLVMLLSALLLQ